MSNCHPNSGLRPLSRVEIIETLRFRDRRCARSWAKIKHKIYFIAPDNEAILNNLATCANSTTTLVLLFYTCSHSTFSIYRLFELNKAQLNTDLNLLTPNVNYSGRTAPLTSKVAFYIFIQQI